jgi:integrase
MPWKLVPPRKGKTPYWYVRGTYLGIALDDSTGAPEKRAAQRILKTWRERAERGEFSRGPAAAAPAPATFLSAAVAYMQAGGERTFVQPILDKLGEKPLESIDQVVVDMLAAELYPKATAATRNRQVYTPVSAILKRAGIKREIRRPVGWRGRKATSWLEPEQAFRLFRAADQVDREFGLLCRFLLYTGMRLGEALSLELRQLHLDRAYVYLSDSKNGEPRGCHLPPFLVEAFKSQPPRRQHIHSVKGRRWRKGEGGSGPRDGGVPFLKRNPDAKLFRFHIGGALRKMLKAAMKAAGLVFPRRQRGFHLFCHTYGSWMTAFGGLDTYGLTRTGRWADPESADRYRHTMASPEARRADLLPTPSRGQIVEPKAEAG